MFRSRPISSQLFSLAAHSNTLLGATVLVSTRNYGSANNKGGKYDHISMDRLRILSLQEIVKGKSYDTKKDRLLMKQQKLATDRKVQLNIKLPLKTKSSYGKYKKLLNEVQGMTDDLVAEMERVHRNANELGLDGEHFNQHSAEYPSKEESQMKWYRHHQKELDEFWFTRWSMGITPYQRMQLKIKDRLENLKYLKEKNFPRSQPLFVDGIKMQQFYSPITDSYIDFMRRKQLYLPSSQGVNSALLTPEAEYSRVQNENFTPLPNLKHENIENDGDELMGLVDITNMDFSDIEIAKEEIKRMYYWENKVSKKALNKVRSLLRKETRIMKQIRKEGARKYMLKRGLVDLIHDPNFQTDVQGFAKAKEEARIKMGEKINADTEERKIDWLVKMAKSDFTMKRALNSKNKKKKKVIKSTSRINDQSTSSLIDERINAGFDKIKNPNQEYYTKSELKELIDTIIQTENLDILTPEDANQLALQLYPPSEREYVANEAKTTGIIPFPTQRIESQSLRFRLRDEIKQIQKTLSAFEWESKPVPTWILRAQQQSRLKRLQEIYTLNAKADQERKEFEKNIWVSDTSMVPDAYSQNDFGLMYRIPLKDFKKIIGRAIKRQTIAKQIKKSSSRSLCLMVREQIADIIPDVDRTLYCQYAQLNGAPSTRGFVFTGEAGTGKTCLLLQAVHHCYRKGFLIFHIPNGYHWTKGRHYVEPSSILPGYFDAPEPTMEFLRNFFKTNSHILSRIKLSQHYGLGDPSVRIATLWDLVNYAIQRGLNEVGVHFKLILDEIMLNKSIPMLFAIDEYNHFTEMSGFKYGNLLRFTEVEPEPVHSNRFVLHRALNRMLLDNDPNKLFVCAHSDSIRSETPLNYDELILTPINVPRYNEKEMQTMINYYCANHFINRPTEEYIHGVRFVSGGKGKDLYEEVSRESF